MATMDETLRLCNEYLEIACKAQQYEEAINKAYRELVEARRVTPEDGARHGAMICRALGHDFARRVLGNGRSLPLYWFARSDW